MDKIVEYIYDRHKNNVYRFQPSKYVLIIPLSASMLIFLLFLTSCSSEHNPQGDKCKIDADCVCTLSCADCCGKPGQIWVCVENKCLLGWEEMTNEIRDCGVEDNQHGEGYNKEARDCFYQAYTDCSLAKFQITHYSFEGGRFISSLSTMGITPEGKCIIRKELDASDYWALGETLAGNCYGLEKFVAFEDSNPQEWFRLLECDASLEEQTTN